MRFCAIVALVGLVAMAAPAGAQTHFELLGSPVRDVVPPDCTDWIELFPTFGPIHHQDLYEDDGDGQVSVCDFITLNGTRYHIDWVGPTYWLVEITGADEMWCEPTIPDPGGNPTCEIWFEVAPGYGDEWHVDDWEDNGDGVLSVCDNVFIGGLWWHVEEIGLNITGTETGSPVEPSTWSKIKAFFQDLFGG